MLSVDRNDNIVQNKCNDDINNKWYFYNDSIISDYNQNCLSVDNNNEIISEPCKITNKNQQWDIKNTDSVVIDNLQETNDKWSTIRGKNVVLLESDNPWYINKEYQPEGIVHPQTTELNTVDYEIAAKYDPSFMIDVTSPDFGHGHSYVERNGAQYYDSCFRDDEKVETFDGRRKHRINFNYIICCLIIVVFTMLAIKYVCDK